MSTLKPEIEIYTAANCAYCVRAKQLLNYKKINFIEIRIDQEGNSIKLEEMIKRSGRRTVPQIFIDDQLIGGCDDLYALDNTGRLDSLLKKP